MTRNSEILRQARFDLQGRWGNFVLATLLMYMLTCAVSMPGAIYTTIRPVDTIISSLQQNGWSLICAIVLAPMTWGYTVTYLRGRRGEELDVTSMFDGFRRAGDYMRTYIVYILRVILWTLLLIIPGIVKSIAYSMTPYILHDTNLTANEAINESQRMMLGHKWQYFFLQLRFIPWGILCILTLGIGFFFLVPYMQAAQAAFYENLRAEEANDAYETNETTSETAEPQEVTAEEPTDESLISPMEFRSMESPFGATYTVLMTKVSNNLVANTQAVMKTLNISISESSVAVHNCSKSNPLCLGKGVTRLRVLEILELFESMEDVLEIRQDAE